MKVFFRNRSEFRSRMAEMHSQALQRSNRDEDTNDSIVADLGDTFQVVATRPDVIGSAHCKCDVCEVCRNRKRKRGLPEELELSLLQCDTAQDRTSNILLANPRRLTEHAAEEGADDPAADDPADAGADPLARFSVLAMLLWMCYKWHYPRALSPAQVVNFF